MSRLHPSLWREDDADVLSPLPASVQHVDHDRLRCGAVLAHRPALQRYADQPVDHLLSPADAVAHISFEVKQAAMAAPAALTVAVAATGVLGLVVSLHAPRCSRALVDRH